MDSFFKIEPASESFGMFKSVARLFHKIFSFLLYLKKNFFSFIVPTTFGSQLEERSHNQAHHYKKTSIVFFLKKTLYNVHTHQLHFY